MDNKQWNNPGFDPKNVYGSSNLGGGQSAYGAYYQEPQRGYGQPAYSYYQNPRQNSGNPAYDNQYNAPRQNYQQEAYGAGSQQNGQQGAYGADPRQSWQPCYNQRYWYQYSGYQQPSYGHNTYSSGSVPGNGLSIAGLVLGICSLVSNMPLSLLGLIFSIISFSQAKKANIKNGIAVAAVVLNAVVLALHIILFSMLIYLIFNSSSFEYYGSEYVIFA